MPRQSSRQGLNVAGKSLSFIASDCQRINDLFGKYGIPKENTYQISRNPNDILRLTIVTIPIFNGRDSISNLLDARVVVEFAPKEIQSSDKIVTYDLLQKFDQSKFKLEKFPFPPPKGFDSIGK